MGRPTPSSSSDVLLSESWEKFATDKPGRKLNIPKLENGGIGTATSVGLDGLLENPWLEEDDMEMVVIPPLASTSSHEE